MCAQARIQEVGGARVGDIAQGVAEARVANLSQMDRGRFGSVQAGR